MTWQLVVLILGILWSVIWAVIQTAKLNKPSVLDKMLFSRTLDPERSEDG